MTTEKARGSLRKVYFRDWLAGLVHSLQDLNCRSRSFACSTHAGQKWATNPLELDLQLAVSGSVDAEK